MTEDEWKAALRAEGFHEVYIWHDGSDVFYPFHSHEGITAHVILSGGMTLEMNGEQRVLHAGERFDIPAGVSHSARMNEGGCTYIVGE